MRIRFSCLFAAILLAIGPAAAGNVPARYDHYDPARLNEFALQKLREGDAGTAAILLERAALLAPHDARIRRNLETLRAWQAGERPEPGSTVSPAKPSMPPPSSGPETAAAEDGLPPFPLWPKR